MNRMIPLLFGLVCLILGGCQTALRAPICREGEMQVPHSIVGRYHFTMPAQSVLFAGATATLEDVVFTISEQSGGYKLGASRNVTIKLGGKKHAFDANPAPELVPLSVCKIGELYYSQTHEDNGTYTIARLDISANGITTIGLIFDQKTLKDHGFSSLFLPKFNEVDTHNEWQFDSPTMIIDNRDQTEAQREVMLSLAQPGPIGTVLTRIKD